MWKSAPSGPATSSAKNSPTLRPVIRRTTSPTRDPWVTEWYPAADPGSHCGACAARRAVADRQSYSSSIGPSQSGRPAVCASRCRTRTPSLPATVNSGEYRPTGAASSRSPRSARTSADSAVIVLVTDQTLAIVAPATGPCGRRRRTHPRDVHHRLAVREDRDRRTRVPVVQQCGQPTRYRGEQVVVGALDVGHAFTSAHRPVRGNQVSPSGALIRGEHMTRTRSRRGEALALLTDGHEPTSVRRRQFLAAAGAVVLAGCSRSATRASGQATPSASPASAPTSAAAPPT